MKPKWKGKNIQKIAYLKWNQNEMKITPKWHIKNQKDQIEMAWKWNQYKMEKSEKNNSN